MLDGVAHWRPLVNGDSGFVPRPYTRARELLDGPMGEEALRLLRAIGTTHVVSAAPQPLPVAARFAADGIYDVPPGEKAAVPPPGTPTASLGSADGIVVDLGAVATVHGLVFELDDRPWVVQPKVEASTDGVRWTALQARASLADATLALYRDPRHGRGGVTFAPVATRMLRVDPALPARPGPLAALP
jgi:hypothetical protein